ncbi:ALOX5 [Mytilus coruscus]|uniref:ALOX5 n=1 Tax=Mytilus coruscus TaxID=42192 RepID=A0A6J8AVK8_MYTCO|nr:ALOX5 [Mytilus coruscus]
MPSHYCRSKTKREYLEPNLSINKMYELYKELCSSLKIIPEKNHLYRNIFNTEFNLRFHIPKKDKCETCEEHKASKSNDITDLDEKYQNHIKDKLETKIERDKDRGDNSYVLCFDLENVVACPWAEVSIFFYKRKINTYNYTAYFSLNKKGYNAVWNEMDARRGRNEIASAIISILRTIIVEHPNIDKICLWSNSCVPQNKNSSMVTALKILLFEHPKLQVIEHKFCSPGHSSIQEVDNIHSNIEKSLKLSDQSVLTGAYHMRDDGLLLYDAIKSYVEKYVLLYYSTEGSLDADYEIQNWGAELVKSRDDGGVGILGVPGDGNFKTTDQLILTLTTIIYTCSAGHAAANFQQYDEYGAPFNYPFHLSGNPPTDKNPVTIETILKAIAKRDMLLETMSITKVLSDKATDSLGYFEKQFIVDPAAIQIVEEFRQKLQEVGKTIDERNQKREFPYDWLLPQAIPNAISI